MTYDSSTRTPAQRRQGTGIRFAPTPDPTAAPASTDPFHLFDDPATNYLTGTIQSQLANLQQPMVDPVRDGVMAFLGKQLGSLSSAPPITFGGGNSLLNDFVTEGRQRIGELNQRPFTDAEEAALKTRTRNDALAQRDAELHRSLERASARGLGKSSGVLEADQQAIDNNFTAADAKNQNDLMLWIADQVQQRKDKAAGIAQQLAATGQAEESINLQRQSAETAANQGRQAQILTLAGSLAQMAAEARGETRARQGDILSLATLLAELPVQRLQLAMNVLNGSGGNNVGSLFGDVVNLNNAQQQSRDAAAARRAQFVNGLTTLAGYYGNRGRS